ncbi:MAG: NUDIX domain-containing protein [Armatimonadota bacterium]|nr:NUDIX domain-containing protein [Armatimonadota bacterium]
MHNQPHLPSEQPRRCAGGVVLREGQVLLLRKRDLPEVRLPKGHLEAGESAAEAALREVAEETGYRCRVRADLGVRTVRFVLNGEPVTREEHYFLMEPAHPDPLPRAPAMEARFDVVWLPTLEALAALTFYSEREALRAALGAASAPGAVRPVVRRLGDTPSVACPCGDAYRVITAAESPQASIHWVNIRADARAHYHHTLTEYYVVLEGEGYVELDGVREAVSPGTVVMIPPGVRHRAVGKLRILNVVVPAFRVDDEHF